MQRIVRSVNEHIFLSRMSMHVYESKNLIIIWRCIALFFTVRIAYIVNNFLDGTYCRMQLIIWSMILSVEVIASHVGPVVSNNNSIWINHRNDFENAPLPKLLCLKTLAKYSLDKSLHHI